LEDEADESNPPAEEGTITEEPDRDATSESNDSDPTTSNKSTRQIDEAVKDPAPPQNESEQYHEDAAMDSGADTEFFHEAPSYSDSDDLESLPPMGGDEEHYQDATGNEDHPPQEEKAGPVQSIPSKPPPPPFPPPPANATSNATHDNTVTTGASSKNGDKEQCTIQ
jgi:hypothetical protein